MDSSASASEEDDPALYDEAEDNEPSQYSAQSGGATTKGAVNKGTTSGGNTKVQPNRDNARADRPELEEDDENMDEGDDRGGRGDGSGAGFPVRLAIRITRSSSPTSGALAIDAVAQDGEIIIENLYHYATTQLADPKSAEDDYARRNVYTGPPFGNLDEDLQILMERYLEERGVDTNMALFVPDFVDWKEQKEYLGWLGNVKKFFE